MPRTSDDWWNESSPNSRVKTLIVSKYADAWAGIMARRLKPGEVLNYVDLYAGRGRYRSGEVGTGLAVLSRIAEGQASTELGNRVHVVMNDRNPAYTSELVTALSESSARSIFRVDPVVTTRLVDEAFVRDVLDELSGPALWFIDPWGYEGVTRDLIRDCTQPWGNDAVLLLNVNAITRSSKNPQEYQNLSRLFGDDYFRDLQERIRGSSGSRIEPEVMRTIISSLRGLGGGRFVSRVGFRFEDRDRNSHFLVLISKHQRGVRTFNDIVERELRESPPDVEGVYVFNSNLAGQSSIEIIARHTFMDAAGRELLSVFRGREVTFERIMKESLDTDLQFSNSTMRKLILWLEEEQRVSVSVPGRRVVTKGKPTLPPRSCVRFPD